MASVSQNQAHTICVQDVGIALLSIFVDLAFGQQQTTSRVLATRKIQFAQAHSEDQEKVISVLHITLRRLATRLCCARAPKSR